MELDNPLLHALLVACDQSMRAGEEQTDFGF
jgi:hypothetical protein